MEINPIYNRYQNRTMSFETTLRLLQELISERLNSDYRRIMVQASNAGRAGRVNFCFTVFFTRDRYNEYASQLFDLFGESRVERGGFYQGYQILTQGVKNFRNFRPDGELGSEVAQIENLIESFRRSCLAEIIS